MRTSLACILATVPVLLANGAGAAPVLADFGAATFVAGAPIDNPFFPVLPGPTRVYRGENDEGVEVSTLSFAGLGPVLGGVQTTTLLDRATEDGLLVEETFDYYAQDTDGNVWYMGEDVTNYRYDDDGNFLGTDSASAWLTGVNGALPGYIMPAVPTLGFNYYQEFAEDDEALDQATIYALDQTVDLGWRTFSGVLVTYETNAFEPDAREFKFYAPGYGQIRAEEGLSPNLDDPELVVNLVAPVPLPATLPFLLAGLAGLGMAARRRA
jgi:PEP-CTERM motif